MIPKVYITEWRKHAPWLQDTQVEQDLLISRVLVEIFQEPFLAESLAFRGGTALYKLLVIHAFKEYMRNDGSTVTRAMYEENLVEKLVASKFSQDILPLLSPIVIWDYQSASEVVMRELISLLPGEAWAGRMLKTELFV